MGAPFIRQRISTEFWRLWLLLRYCTDSVLYWGAQPLSTGQSQPMKLCHLAYRILHGYGNFGGMKMMALLPYWTHGEPSGQVGEVPGPGVEGWEGAAWGDRCDSKKFNSQKCVHVLLPFDTGGQMSF